MLKQRWFAIMVLAISLVLMACATAKAPADAAIKAADEALAAVRAEAAKVMPAELKAVEDALAAAKANYQKGEYQQALTGAKDVSAKVKDLAATAATKKDELTSNWQEMSGGIPGMMGAISKRVEILSKARTLPAGLDKEKLESVKATLATANQTWTEAASAFATGNLADAVGKAKSVKETAVEIMNTLGMKPPEAAQK